MTKISAQQGIGTLVNHVAEGEDPLHATTMPIYQTSTFSFPDVAAAAAAFRGDQKAYIYTRYDNPNANQLVRKYAVLEGLDLLRARPEVPAEDLVDGHLFASGMAAATTAILARVKGGETIIAQESLYSACYNFLHDVAPRYGIQVIWLQDTSVGTATDVQSWEAAFDRHPNAVLAYLETPANPAMAVVDIAAVAEIAHAHHAWLMVDNTFATPFCQRPLTLGADVIIHSTTKYLAGHGLLIGGAVISTQTSYVRNELFSLLKIMGGTPSPFDAWLANTGLKTFELRMQRHCENAAVIARHLEAHPAVARVFYPGLESHPQHAIARKQMSTFGGMVSFELKGGLEAGARMMGAVRLATLAPTLGNTDTLVQHPASMSHSAVARETRLKMGITDGLVRLSVGIENVEDILADLEQAMA
jgi:methionine-gamma-lyase